VTEVMAVAGALHLTPPVADEPRGDGGSSAIRRSALVPPGRAGATIREAICFCGTRQKPIPLVTSRRQRASLKSGLFALPAAIGTLVGPVTAMMSLPGTN